MARVTYADRIARAIAKAAAEGRTISRQEARGHRAKEHVIRKERAAIRQSGGQLPPRRPVRSSHAPPPPPPPKRPVSLTGALSPQERKAVRAFARAQADRAGRDAGELADDAVRWATRQGYERFEILRRVTRQRQAQYRREGRTGEPSVKGILGQWAAEFDDPPVELFYYH